ncbi:MAG: hypothetical protein ACO1N0_09625 [Fluviicola sp.]
MKCSPTSILKGVSVFLVIILLTACPSPKKIDEYIQLNEHQKTTDKYLDAFKRSGDSNISHLSFYSVIGGNDVKTIELMREGWRPEESWIPQVLLFQEILEDKHLKYESIRVFDKAKKEEMFEFGYDNLLAYRKVYKLFKKNLESIKTEKYSELQPLLQGSLSLKTLEELLEFAPIESTDEFTPVNYADFVESNSYVSSLNCVTFKTRTKSGSWLYFNYSSDEEIHLTSIDLKKE